MPRTATPLLEPLEARHLMAVGTVTEQIIVDQFGWRADAARKVVLFADPIAGQNAAVAYTPGGSFQVRRAADDGVAFTGSVVAWNGGATDSVSGDKVWSGDFSGLTAPGDYYVYDPANNLRSYPFRLDNGVFNGVLKTSARMFYYQRAGYAIDAAHGGNWTHAAGHVGPNQDHAAVLWRNGAAVAGTAKDVWGGWYDAGDYNKYVPYTTGVMWDLLSAYEWNPGAFPDAWNIPESGNGVPDVLDEAKVETDWLLRMQNADGSVLNRVANGTYAAGNFDPSTDTQRRYYTQATTWATAGFAASAAHAARVFSAFDAQYPGYSQALRAAAEKAWAYLQATPNMTPSTGLDGGGTGGSVATGGGLAATEAGTDANGDRRVRVLAAAELYKTIGTAAYKTYFESNYKNSNTSDNGFHPLLNGTPYFDASLASDLNRAYVTYATTTGASATIVGEIKNALKNNLDPNGFLQAANYNGQADPYRAFMWSGHYTWGSNQLKAQWATILTFAVKLNVGTAAEQTKAKEIAEEYLHYFHGRNPLSYVYLSNMGTKGANLGGDKSPMQVYHSWFGDGSPLYDGANSTYSPVPGYLVGGPNQYFSNAGTIRPPGGEPPMKAFRDWNTGYPEASWEITEPAIYDQAAYTLLLSQFAAAPAPAVQSVKVNDGDAQRSMVKQLTVTFDRAVAAAGGAFALTRRAVGDGPTVSVGLTAANPSGDGRTWVLSFDPAATAPGGSLADGVYDLTARAAAVTDAAAGVAMAADYAFKFHRLFSDADGDGDSDNADLLQWRPTLLKPSTDPAYTWWLDYDQNGAVDNLDVFQVRSRRGITYQGY